MREIIKIQKKNKKMEFEGKFIKIITLKMLS